MSATIDNVSLDDEALVDYEAEEEVAVVDDSKDAQKGSYAGITVTGFRDFLLKDELLQAIADCGFEHPSEVQTEVIPQAILGTDIICQAKSGMGKTAVAILAILQQLEIEEDKLDSLIICHTREMAYQIAHEFERFSKHMPGVKVAALFGGVPLKQQVSSINDEKPNIIVSTPGRCLQLVKNGTIKVAQIKRFVLDECDKLITNLETRRDIQEIFRLTPHEKQTMMFSATINKDIRPVCKKFAQQPIEIYIDDESKLTLHGVQQYYVKLAEKEKIRKLVDIFDNIEFSQVVVFAKNARRAATLTRLLRQNCFPAQSLHANMSQNRRIERLEAFRDNKNRILVATDICGRGVDLERVNVVVNFDMPDSTDTYLHRIARGGRFGTKSLALTFVSTPEESKILESVQSRFEVEITAMPAKIDSSTYTTA